MSWYKEAQEHVPPEEVGYNTEWGEHHGPVSTKLDTWSYGTKGYNPFSPPMPLPKVLYHVTPFPEKIMEEGFKAFDDPDQQTFGGHGEYVSFRSLKNAETYQEAYSNAYNEYNTMKLKANITPKTNAVYYLRDSSYVKDGLLWILENHLKKNVPKSIFDKYVFNKNYYDNFVEFVSNTLNA